MVATFGKTQVRTMSHTYFTTTREIELNCPESLNCSSKLIAVACPGILFFFGGGVQQIQLRTEDREKGDLGGGSPLVRGSEGSCNLVTRNFISYSKIFIIFGTLRLFMMTNNLSVIANVKQLRSGGSFRILLHFFRISRGVGVLNSAIFNSFHNRVEFGTILEGLRNLGGGGGGLNPPKHPPR